MINSNVEAWREIPGFEGLYMLSNFKRIKRLQRTIELEDGSKRTYKEKIEDPDKYKVSLYKDKKEYKFSLNSLIFSTWPELLDVEDLPGEIWKDCVGYEGYYKVSNLGRIKSVPRSIKTSTGKVIFRIGKLIGQFLDRKDIKNAYFKVDMNKDGASKKEYVHKMVANAFHPNPNNLPCVNHKDCNKQNNKAENLEHCTYEYNRNYVPPTNN